MSHSCKTTRERLHGELDGELAAADSRSVQQHVADCTSCAGHRQQLQSVTELLRTAATSERPADLQLPVTGSLRPAPLQPQWRALPVRQQPASLTLARSLRSLVAVAALLLLALTLGQFSQRVAPADSPSQEITDVTLQKTPSVEDIFVKAPTDANGQEMLAVKLETRRSNVQVVWLYSPRPSKGTQQ